MWYILVIIPTIGESPFLKLVLDCLSDYLIISNGENDICDQYDNCLHYGLEGWTYASAVNYGILSTIADRIILLNDDTVPTSNIEKVYYEKAERGKMLLGPIYREDQQGDLQPDLRLRGDIIQNVLYNGGSNVCFMRDDALEVGLLSNKYNQGYGYAETDFYNKMYSNGCNIEMVKEASVVHKYSERGPSHFDNLSRNRKIFRRRWD